MFNKERQIKLIKSSISFMIIFVIVFMFVIPLNSFASTSFENKTNNVCDNEKIEVNHRETISYSYTSLKYLAIASYEKKIGNLCNEDNTKKSNRKSDACSKGQCPISLCYPIITVSQCNYHVYLDNINTVTTIKNFIIVSQIYSVFKPPKKSLI